MSKTIWNLKRGESAKISGYKLDLSTTYQIRLIDFGFHIGERITCLFIPNLGAPRQFMVNGGIYSLDDKIASLIEIEDEKEALSS